MQGIGPVGVDSYLVDGRAAVGSVDSLDAVAEVLYGLRQLLGTECQGRKQGCEKGYEEETMHTFVNFLEFSVRQIY